MCNSSARRCYGTLLGRLCCRIVSTEGGPSKACWDFWCHQDGDCYAPVNANAECEQHFRRYQRTACAVATLKNPCDTINLLVAWLTTLSSDNRNRTQSYKNKVKFFALDNRDPSVGSGPKAGWLTAAAAFANNYSQPRRPVTLTDTAGLDCQEPCVWVTLVSPSLPALSPWQQPHQ